MKNDAFRLRDPERVSILRAVWRQLSFEITNQKRQETSKESFNYLLSTSKTSKRIEGKKNHILVLFLQRRTKSFSTLFLAVSSFVGSFKKRNERKKKKEKRKKDHQGKDGSGKMMLRKGDKDADRAEGWR